MTNETAQKLKQGDDIYFAGSFYRVAKLKDFPHGIMVGIYDEPPTKHIDYLQPCNIMEALPCYACQGGGCPVCSGSGLIIQ